MMRALLMSAIILITTLNSGCATRIEYQTLPLPIVPRPVLPAIAPAELECLSDDTYKTLVTRQRLLRQWGEELELIIMNTQVKQ